MNSSKTEKLETLLNAAPVVPVIVVDSADDAVPLARALVAGGLPAIEITLRTPAALDAIKAVREEVEGAYVGAGTVLTSDQVSAVEQAGCDFAVTPGVSPSLLDAIDASSVPYLPGCATASEALTLADRGYRYVKFFPAAAAGGIGYLKSLAGPLPDIKFCPTGGVNLTNAPDYLSLANVICVGGSWVAPSASIRAGDWAEIQRLAEEARALTS